MRQAIIIYTDMNGNPSIWADSQRLGYYDMQDHLISETMYSDPFPYGARVVRLPRRVRATIYGEVHRVCPVCRLDLNFHPHVHTNR